MNILILPENSERDSYMLEPLFKALMMALGKPKAKVKTCPDPSFKGITTVLNVETLLDVFEEYDPYTQIYILVVDRDGVEDRAEGLYGFKQKLGKPNLFATCAIEEMETWIMAGCKLSPKMRWQDVRAQVKTSEGYFRQFANDRGLTETVAQGRKTLGEEASRNLPAIRQKCPEFNDLANKLEKHLAS